MTLIEVLVALIVFALGMLGAGGLIMSSLRSSQFSTNASVAISLARDYGELVQMIPPLVASSTATGTNVFVIDTSTTATAPTAWCKTADCDVAQMIALNLWDWEQKVINSLPDGRAKVCKDMTPKDSDGLYKWDCDDAGTMLVVKFGWHAKTGAAGTGDDNLRAVGGGIVRPKLVISLFGNQEELDATAAP